MSPYESKVERVYAPDSDTIGHGVRRLEGYRLAAPQRQTHRRTASGFDANELVGRLAVKRCR